MSVLARIFGKQDERELLRPLYDGIVAIARAPEWFREGGVPDTVDGRFDMVAAVLALVLLRLEQEGEAGKRPSLLLTEIFIDDMDGALRQIGIGDFVVGKHVGRMMGALGGRMGAFRGSGDLEPAVTRNIFHDSPPSPAQPRFIAGRLTVFRAELAATPLASLLAGNIS